MLLRSKRRISPNEGALVTAGSGIEVVLPANRKKNENVSREITFLLACAALWAEKPEIVSQLVESGLRADQNGSRFILAGREFVIFLC